MQIILARHGQPELRLDSWFRPMALQEWLRLYDAAGLAPGAVPAATRAQAAAAGVLACSDLRRCTESAQRLAPGRAVLGEALFREAEPPWPAWLDTRLPPLAWAAMFRLARFPGPARPAPATAQRARQAAQRLVELARRHGSVLLVGHGLMGQLIARELRALGWQGPRQPASGYWQCSVYRAPD